MVLKRSTCQFIPIQLDVRLLQAAGRFVAIKFWGVSVRHPRRRAKIHITPIKEVCVQSLHDVPRNDFRGRSWTCSDHCAFRKACVIRLCANYVDKLGGLITYHDLARSLKRSTPVKKTDLQSDPLKRRVIHPVSHVVQFRDGVLYPRNQLNDPLLAIYSCACIPPKSVI